VHGIKQKINEQKLKRQADDHRKPEVLESVNAFWWTPAVWDGRI